MNATPKLFSTLLIAAALTSCANTKIANDESLTLAAQQEAIEHKLTATEIIEQASLAITKAKSEDLPFYAPLHIAKAEKTLSKAQKLNRKAETDEDKQQAKSAAITVQKLVQEAYQTKTIVEKQLAASFERKAIVDALDSKKVLPKQYRKTIEAFTVLIKDVEGGLFDNVAKGQPQLLDTFTELEANTMRELWLKKAIIMLDKAKDADADNFAEVTFNKADDAIDSANNFIDAHYSNREGVKEITFKAYNLAAQAYYLALEAEQLFDANEEDIESYLLNIQKRFNTINEHGLVDNLSSHSFKTQAELLATQVEAQHNQLETSEAQVVVLNNTINTLKTNNSGSTEAPAIKAPSLADSVESAMTKNKESHAASEEQPEGVTPGIDEENTVTATKAAESTPEVNDSTNQVANAEEQTQDESAAPSIILPQEASDDTEL